MADTARIPVAEPLASTTANARLLPGRGAKISIPPSVFAANPTPSRLRCHLGLVNSSPVNQNGSFEFDRVLKSGYVQKRTQKTKTWKTVYLVLRPNALSIYKTEKENKLRHKIYLSELSAVTLLKDPKGKRNNLFGLFSPAKNYHLEAPTLKEAQEWIELIRDDARIEEEEEEMFLASPVVRRQSYAAVGILGNISAFESERHLSSSPEPIDPSVKPSMTATVTIRRASHNLESSGMSGNELMSHSDFSDTDAAVGPSNKENIPVGRPSSSAVQLATDASARLHRPMLGDRNFSQLSGLNIENDPDRVVWQGWLFFLKSKRGVKQWKKCWGVLRPRNLILYKDESEYTAAFITALSAVVNVVDIDPVSKTKLHCMQVITDEKSYRFCAHDEEALVQCLGAFKSLLSKRKELEARQNAAGHGNVAPR